MTTLEKAVDVVTRKSNDGSVVVMKLDNSNYFYKITGIAAEIWSEVDGGKPLSEVRDTILKRYNVAAEQLDQDIECFVKKLKEYKFIL